MTTAVYMGVATLPGFMDRLISDGLPGETPVVVVENATRQEERALRGEATSISGLVAAASVTGPCLVLIGEAMRARDI